MSVRQSKPVVCALFAASLSLGGVVFAQGVANNQHLRFTQEHGITFSTIGDVGNPTATVANWHPPGPATRQAGSVSYEYRMATTEVSWRQYHEFVQAYAPVMPVHFRPGIGTDDSLVPGAPGTGPVRYVGLKGGVPQYTLDESRADKPATSTWQLFARMVNWLHNGAKPASEVTSADFETGAYDTSTFMRIPDGPLGSSYRTDQDERSPGARFWIPNLDELIKATYYDPNRYGEGEGGYWLYGNSSDDLPMAGDPALGGQTNAGRVSEWPAGHSRPLDVGSYPDEQSPWGLLDAVGGGREWSEVWNSSEEFLQSSRHAMISQAFQPVAGGELGVGWLSFSPASGLLSLRIAAAIPGPGPGAVLMIFSCAFARRRGRSF